MYNFLKKIFKSNKKPTQRERSFLNIYSNTEVSKIFDSVSNFNENSEIRYVGGCVRKILNQEEVDDMDLAVNLNPDEVKKCLQSNNIKFFETGIEHGTITANLGKKNFEITSLREDVDTDGRHAKVKYTKDWLKDSSRRDFTFNSIYADKEGNLFDPNGGAKHLDEGRVIFIGDPKALFDGLLGDEIQNAVSNNNINKRSLSAYVWSFAAKTQGLDLLHHNVLFNKNYRTEFDDIKRGEIPKDPTLYICAQGSINNPRPKEKSLGRFEIIINGSPTYNHKKYNKQKEYTKCKEITFSILDSMGLKMDLKPTEEMLTTPKEFEQLFPGSQGSLYGRTPHGISSTFMRPRNKSKIKGLLLAGGGTHPGAGIPMACLSGKHAAEMILKDLSLI